MRTLQDHNISIFNKYGINLDIELMFKFCLRNKFHAEGARFKKQVI